MDISTHPDASPGGDFWAVTTYFNPAGFRRRRANFGPFRQNLQLPLAVVEVSFNGRFELGPDDADILIQLEGHDVLWQKERLLNLALAALPAHCDKVAWLDCDIIFDIADWPERAARLLDRYAILQPFSHLHDAPVDWRPGNGPPATSIRLRHPDAWFVASGVPVSDCLGTPTGKLKRAGGIAWVARRALLEAHGFYDPCIVGGGDGAFVRAAYGCFGDAIRLQAMSPAMADHYLAWARPFHDGVGDAIGFLDGKVFHLWHGAFEDRQYDGRQRGLAPYAFDPFTDIAQEENGVWRWSSDKPEMHAYVRDYFASRREDG